MKTTLELPDELLIEAKKRAAELRKPLRTLIEAGLRRELAASTQRGANEPPIKVEWLTVDGDLPEGLDVDDRTRMHDWIERER